MRPSPPPGWGLNRREGSSAETVESSTSSTLVGLTGKEIGRLLSDNIRKQETWREDYEQAAGSAGRLLAVGRIVSSSCEGRILRGRGPSSIGSGSFRVREHCSVTPALVWHPHLRPS